MQLEILKNIGLTEGEIAVYSSLLDNGALPASRIIEITGLKKGDCYNKLYDLIEKGLVEEFEQNKVKNFRLTHPGKIESYIEHKKKHADAAHKEISAVLPFIISSYNLSYHQPGVRVFEGREAIDILFRDSLNAKSEILAYIDFESINKHLGRRAYWYTKNRIKLGINKYNLVFDSDYNRNYIKKHPLDHTFERVVDLGDEMRAISLQIYDNKIVYHNLDPQATIGVIIEDKIMANLQRQIWRWMWNRS